MYLGFRKGGGGGKSRCRRHRVRDTEGVEVMGLVRDVYMVWRPENFAIFFLEILQLGEFSCAF